MLPAQGLPVRPMGMRLKQVDEGPSLGDGGLSEAIRHERLMTVRIGPEALRAATALDADDFEAREAASRALLDPAIGDAELWALLDRDTLSHEARERLLDAACQRILTRPRGALGIRMGTVAPPQVGVVVQSTVPGMPADRLLLAGDILQKVDDIEVTSVNGLAVALQSRAPGHEVRLQVLRSERDKAGKPLLGPDGQPVERQVDLRVPLGNATELERVDRMDMRAGIGQVSNVVLQQQRIQATVLQRRFSPRPGAEVVPTSPDRPAEGDVTR